MKLPALYHDLSPSERRLVREEYVKKQEGKCFFCKNDLSSDPPKRVRSKTVNWKLFPRGKGFLDHPVHLQHDHSTGMTEGAVHALCNAVWWQYEGR